MHATHSILVNVPEAVSDSGYTLSEMSKDDLKNLVVKYAEEQTERFYGPVFDSQDLLEEGQDDDYPNPVLFSKDDWEGFAEWLLMCDNSQKRYAAFLCSEIEEDARTGNLCDLVSRCFLTHNREANIDHEQYCKWEFDSVRWQLKHLFNLVCGTYFFDSDFYNTYSKNAFVPYLSELKESADDWALVAFDCHE